MKAVAVIIVVRQKGIVNRVSLSDTKHSTNHNISLGWQERKVYRAMSSRKEQGPILKFLRLSGVGPAQDIEYHLAPRLNLITGDNGLGKTFLLECAWWALTGFWARYPARPRQDSAKDAP